MEDSATNIVYESFKMGITRGTRTRRKVQNAMNKKKGLKTSVETSTISTNNIFNVIFSSSSVQNYLLEAMQKGENEYILSMPAVALQIDRLFYTRQHLDL